MNVCIECDKITLMFLNWFHLYECIISTLCILSEHLNWSLPMFSEVFSVVVAFA